VTAGTATPAERQALLGGVPTLAGLPDDELAALAAASAPRRLAKGQVLFSEGELSDCVYVLATGRLKILVSSPHGESLVLAVLTPGESFGELSVLDGQRRSATAESVEPVELVAIPSEALLGALERHPAAALGAARELAGMLRRATGQSADLVFLDLPRRLAKLLLADAGDTAAPPVRVSPGRSQTDLAARLGVTRQSVNRALGALTRRGWLRVDGAQITLLDVAALRRLVGTS
jgi:CRP/FNR family cyclic AMP-dependent transcriptional regulator